MAALATISPIPLRPRPARFAGAARIVRPALAGLALWAAPLHAHGTTEFFVAADLTGFHYEEFLEGETAVFNREQGVIPGARLSLQGDEDGAFLRIDATYHAGTVDYWSPANGDSTTDTGFLTLAAEGGMWFDHLEQWGGYLRLARRIWDRDIRGTANASGIHERYRWSEVGLGLRRAWSLPDGNWRHELSATLFAVTDGSISVGLSGVEGRDWDDETLDLGDEGGLRLRYTATRQWGSRTVRVEPYYEYWEFGRSDRAPVTSDGAPTGLTVYEPRSESQRLGVAVGLVF